jgi:hypothetical protein
VTAVFLLREVAGSTVWIEVMDTEIDEYSSSLFSNNYYYYF